MRLPGVLIWCVLSAVDSKFFLQTITFYRFLRLQPRTSGSQNISESPICFSFGDCEICGVSNCRVIHSCWVQVHSWRVRNEVILGDDIMFFHLWGETSLVLLMSELLCPVTGTAACQMSKEKYWMCCRSTCLLTNGLFKKNYLNVLQENSQPRIKLELNFNWDSSCITQLTMFSVPGIACRISGTWCLSSEGNCGFFQLKKDKKLWTLKNFSVVICSISQEYRRYWFELRGCINSRWVVFRLGLNLRQEIYSNCISVPSLRYIKRLLLQASSW